MSWLPRLAKWRLYGRGRRLSLRRDRIHASSTGYRWLLISLFILNMSTFATRKTASILASHMICRLSLGSWRLCSLICFQRLLTTPGLDSYKRRKVSTASYHEPRGLQFAGERQLAYLRLPSQLRESRAQHEGLLKPATSLALARCARSVAGVDIAIIV